MIDELSKERDQRLVAAVMFYFEQRDAGLELRFADILDVIPDDLRTDLTHLVAAVNHSRAGHPPDTEPWSKPIEVIQQALRELRAQQ